MNKRRLAKRLVLSKETLHDLSNAAQKEAAGGGSIFWCVNSYTCGDWSYNPCPSAFRTDCWDCRVV